VLFQSHMSSFVSTFWCNSFNIRLWKWDQFWNWQGIWSTRRIEKCNLLNILWYISNGFWLLSRQLSSNCRYCQCCFGRYGSMEWFKHAKSKESDQGKGADWYGNVMCSKVEIQVLFTLGSMEGNIMTQELL